MPPAPPAQPCHPGPDDGSTPGPLDPGLAVVQDHSRVYAQFTYVYPVISRRSRGLSIGVNLNPDKRCNFDCVYCEVDRVTPAKVTWVDLDTLASELQTLIRSAKDGTLASDPKFREVPGHTRIIRDIAFSGDGEPTMVNNFAACVARVVDVKRRESLEDTKLVLITDAAGLDKLDVRRGLEIMRAHQGEVWGKLDAGTEPYFKAINRTSIRFDRILSNLLLTAREQPIIIQSLFLRWQGDLMPAAELDAYCDRLNEVTRGGGAIREVHAYTVARPTPEPEATRLTLPELDQFAATIRTRTGLPVHTFA